MQTEKITWIEKTVKIGDLKDYPKNPRKFSKDDFNRLVRDIKQDGYHKRILVDIDLTIIGGHKRKEALLKAGFSLKDDIKVLMPSRKLTQDEFDRLNVKDNLYFGEFDFDMLADFFDADQLADWGMPAAQLIHFYDDELEPEITASENKAKDKKRVICPNCKHQFIP